MLQTEYAKGVEIAPTPDGADDTTSYRATIDLATGDLTLNNIIEMGPLPAGCVLVDAILDTDDLDSGTPAITLDVGIMSGDFGVVDGARTCGAEILSAVTTAQAGGVVRPTLASAFRIARSDVDRGIGLKIKAAPGTAAAGTVGLTVIYRG